MLQKHCVKCGKQLSANDGGGLCNLCSIGLAPAEPLDQINNAEAESPVEGRVLAGSYCPHCHAEMTLADLSRRSCSICGAVVIPEALRMPPGPIVVDKRLEARPLGLRENRWPDDAPLW
jgi:hypothetical protein